MSDKQWLRFKGGREGGGNHEPFSRVKENKMHVVNTFRTCNGPPKFRIELEADWLIILDEVHMKSPD